MDENDIAGLREILNPGEGETLADAAKRLKQADAFDQLVRALYRLRRTRCPTMRFGFETADLVAALRRELEELEEAADVPARRGEGGDVIAGAIHIGISLTDAYPSPNSVYLSDLMYGVARKINGRLDVIDAGGTWEGAKAVERGEARASESRQDPLRTALMGAAMDFLRETSPAAEPRGPAYMAPEQDRSQPLPWAYDAACDLADLRDSQPGSESHRAAVAAAWALHDSLVAAASAETMTACLAALAPHFGAVVKTVDTPERLACYVAEWHDEAMAEAREEANIAGHREGRVECGREVRSGLMMLGLRPDGDDPLALVAAVGQGLKERREAGRREGKAAGYAAIARESWDHWNERAAALLDLLLDRIAPGCVAGEDPEISASALVERIIDLRNGFANAAVWEPDGWQESVVERCRVIAARREAAARAAYEAPSPGAASVAHNPAPLQAVGQESASNGLLRPQEANERAAAAAPQGAGPGPQPHGFEDGEPVDARMEPDGPRLRPSLVIALPKVWAVAMWGDLPLRVRTEHVCIIATDEATEIPDNLGECHTALVVGDEATVRHVEEAMPAGSLVVVCPPPAGDRLEHWRAWSELYDPFPEQPPEHDNERRMRVNWWIEMLEGTKPREGRLAPPERPSEAPEPGCAWVWCWSPDRLREDGTVAQPAKWRWWQIDEPAADIVAALQGRVPTSQSCGGHKPGELAHVWLADGRVLVVLPDWPAFERMEALAHTGRAEANAGGPSNA
jgi:hypothetical protein